MAEKKDLNLPDTIQLVFYIIFFLAFTVRFDHPLMGQRSTLNLVFVDTKTISFYTPQCPVTLTKENPSCTIPIVVTQNDVELARIDFVYQAG